MGVVAPLMMAASTAVGVFGQLQAGQAAKSAADFNSGIQSMNANFDKQQAKNVDAAGEAQAGIQGLKTRASVGGIKANQGASNIDVNSGSAQQVQSSAAEIGTEDATTIRRNATKQAYALEVQASGATAQADLDRMEGSQDMKSAEIGAASTFLGGAGSTASQWQKYQMDGAM